MDSANESTKIDPIESRDRHVITNQVHQALLFNWCTQYLQTSLPSSSLSPLALSDAAAAAAAMLATTVIQSAVT